MPWRLASLAWPNDSAIGKRFRFPGQGPWTEIIGVVGHVRHDGLGIDQRSYFDLTGRR